MTPKAFCLIFLLITKTALAQHPTFRWDVKTLTDSSGIDWLQELEKTKHGRFATIEGLTTKGVQFTNCLLKTKNTRRFDEQRVVKLKIKLVKVKKETNDNDYHIVIQSLTNRKHQMVAEIPDPGDEEYNDSEYDWLRDLLTGLRAQIDSLLGDNVTTKFKPFPPNTLVTIYGIPFWDCKHPGEVSGAAKDFREIHPVLEIKE